MSSTKLLPGEKGEPEIQREILDYLLVRKLTMKDVFAWRNVGPDLRRNSSKHHLSGVPDILGCFCGRMLAIEVKDRVGVVSDEQKDFIKEVTRLGGIAFVARSLKDVLDVLDKEAA